MTLNRLAALLSPHEPRRGRRGRLAALVSILAAMALAGGGCAQRSAVRSGAPTGTVAELGAAAPPPLSPRDPRLPLFARLDSLIVAYDEAKNGGRVDEAASVRAQLAQEVGAAHPALLSAADGREGLPARYLAVSALGFSGRPEATPLLVRAVADGDDQLVGNALIALHMRADPRTPLGPILSRMDPRQGAMARRYAPLALASVLDARAEAKVPVEADVLSSCIARLSALASDGDPAVRLHVARAAGALRSPHSFDLLEPLVADENTRVRWGAAAALERTGDIRGFPPLVRLLHATPPESKHIIRDILVAYAARLQGQPLTTDEITRLGAGPRAWSEWYADLKSRRGVE